MGNAAPGAIMLKTRLSIVLLALSALVFASGCTRTQAAFAVGAAIIGTAIVLDHDDHHHHSRRHHGSHHDSHYSGHNSGHYSSHHYDYCD